MLMERLLLPSLTIGDLGPLYLEAVDGGVSSKTELVMPQRTHRKSKKLLGAEAGIRVPFIVTTSREQVTATSERHWAAFLISAFHGHDCNKGVTMRSRVGTRHEIIPGSHTEKYRIFCFRDDGCLNRIEVLYNVISVMIQQPEYRHQADCIEFLISGAEQC